jgi:hypothetical protein
MIRSKVCCLLAAAAVVLALAAPAYPWAYATHAYFAERLGERQGNLNFQEMYGSMLPDQYNFISDPYGVYLAALTHGDPQDVSDAAWDCRTRAVAFGFASHHEAWGADFTAHIAGITTPPGVGYVVLKGMELAPALVPTLTQILVDAGAPPLEAAATAAYLAPYLGHLLVEEAADWLVKKNLQPSIGTRVMNAARLRTAEVPALLSGAYAQKLVDDLGMTRPEATMTLALVERQYRKMIFEYGRGFLGNSERVMDFLALQGVTVGELILSEATGLPVEITLEQAEELTRLAVDMVRPTYREELAGTLEYLRGEMESRGVETCEPRGR